MASIITRNSVLAVKPESAEATPASPSAATDFVALQPDFTMSPNISSLQNEELKSSLAPGKAIQGLEAPQASFSHYLKASGTVATAPEFKELLEAAIGTEGIAVAEYDTVNSSSTTVFKLGSSEADTFERGEILLIKDSTNGYRIRGLDAASGTDLTLGFAVPTAPVSGVNLGRCVLYKPVNTGHQTLTLWHYLGNSGAVQMMAGARVTQFEVGITAGELINASYQLEGVNYYFNPIQITSGTKYIDWTDDDGTFAAAVTVQWYRSPQELADAIETAMNDSSSTQTYTVDYVNSTGKFSIVGTGTLLSLLWNSGTNTASSIATKIGFTTAADSTGTAATTGYSSANAMTLTAPYTPSYDSSDPVAAKNQECMIGTSSDYSCFRASEVTITVATPKADIPDVCATSGVSGSVITERKTTIAVKALLTQYDAKPFYNFQVNQSVKFQFSFGQKSGGNWVAGSCGAVYVPTCVITSVSVEDQDGLAFVSLTLEAFANSSGQGEVYVGFV